MSEYLSPGLTIAPEIAAGRNKPLGPLAMDAGVNAAYQALMSAITQGDLDKSYYQGQLTTNLGRSQADRARQQLAAQQSMADRGILNSGAALGRQADINTQYDQYDTDVTNQTNRFLDAIGMNITGLESGYQNEQIAGSGRYTQAQAAAADQAIQRQQDLDTNAANMAQMIAALAPQPAPVYNPPPPPTQYTAPTAKKFAPPPAYKPPAYVSGQTGLLAQKKIAGPQ